MKAWMAIGFGVALAFAFPLPASAQQGGRYLQALQTELQGMGLSVQCGATKPTAAVCTTRLAGSNSPGAPVRTWLLKLEYDDDSDTIYVYVDRYATVAASSPDAAVIMQRLMELNWEMLVGRFEWSRTSGEVRLGAVLNTDSNFDRRALRSVVRALVRLADRYADEVGRLTHSAVGGS